jgi:amino acid adenylation domain-containing protein
VTAGRFALPMAWRATDRDSPGEGEAVVKFGDLDAALGVRYPSAGAGPRADLAAAHVKVLSMLTEERTLGVEVAGGPHESARRLGVEPGAWATWRDLVAAVSGALPDLPTAGDETGEAGQAEDSEGFADRALFVTDPAGPANAAAISDPTDITGHGDGARGPAASHYGLITLVRGDVLVLRASHGGLSPDSLRRLAAMYRNVLEAMAESADGDARAARLSDGERRELLAEWGVGASVARGPATVVDLFQAQAARTPDAPAVRTPDGSLTYRELDQHSLRIARHLLARGARPDAPVGVCLRRSADLLPALLGVWRSGAPYLPLDLDLPAQRLRRMVASAGCGLVITRSEHVSALPELTDTEFVLLDQDREAIDALPATPTGAQVGPTHPAYVMYTSGSTGAPKGVLVHHGGLVNYLLWTVDEYAAQGAGGSPFFTSISFDLQVPSLFAPLLSGQTVDLLPDPLETADLGALLAAGAPYSFIKMTPGHLNLLSLDLEPGQAHGLAGLVIAAGDAFPGALARRWIGLAGPGGTSVATEYGPTEITVGNSGQRITDPDAEGLIPLGLSIPNTSMYVLTDRLEPVPAGVPGEVYIGGAGVACGYLGQPALTADRFVPDPYGPAGSRLYRTGDRARWRAGELEFLGRTDHQLKIRGHRVEIGEIRETLRRHPDIAEAVVIAVEQPPRPTRLAAFVVLAPGRTLDLPGLRAALAADLPGYMIPAAVTAIGEVPLTANGKVDTKLLQSL